MRTELHFHLLPGVDDGPRDDREAVDLARLAVDDGTGRVVATPHAHLVEIAEVPRRVERLRATLRKAEVPLEVLGGAELSPEHVALFEQSQFETIAQGPPGARWLLLEAPLMRPDPGLADAARELRDRGFGVLIGHPERSRYTTLPTVRELVEEGSVIQINASSLVGGHGAETARRALEIVRSGLPFVLASDAHTPRRPPLLTRGAAALAAAGFSRGLIQFAVDHGPERLLREGLPLSWPALAAVG